MGELRDYYSGDMQPRGEYVLVIEGRSPESLEEEERSIWKDITLEDQLMKYIAEGLSKKDAVARVAEERGVPKKQVYAASIEIRQN